LKSLAYAAFVVAVAAVGTARGDSAAIGTAQQKLVDARETLKSAKGTFGGHQQNAVNLINRAIEELQAAQREDLQGKRTAGPRPTPPRRPQPDRIQKYGH